MHEIEFAYFTGNTGFPLHYTHLLYSRNISKECCPGSEDSGAVSEGIWRKKVEGKTRK